MVILSQKQKRGTMMELSKKKITIHMRLNFEIRIIFWICIFLKNYKKLIGGSD